MRVKVNNAVQHQIRPISVTAIIFASNMCSTEKWLSPPHAVLYRCVSFVVDAGVELVVIWSRRPIFFFFFILFYWNKCCTLRCSRVVSIEWILSNIYPARPVFCAYPPRVSFCRRWTRKRRRNPAASQHISFFFCGVACVAIFSRFASVRSRLNHRSSAIDRDLWLIPRLNFWSTYPESYRVCSNGRCVTRIDNAEWRRHNPPCVGFLPTPHR